MNIRSITLLVLITGLLMGGLGSCLDEIKLDVPKGTDEIIVIQGQVIKGAPSIISITVSRLFDFTGNSIQPVNVRTVMLRDEAGNELNVPSTELGIYEMRLSANDARFQIEEGKSYQLIVSTFDERTYYSSFETLEPKIKADSLSIKRVVKEIPDGNEGFIDRDFLQYGIHTKLGRSETGNRSYLRWVIERTYRLTDGSVFSSENPKTCYITQKTDVTNIAVLDPNLINGNQLDDFIILEDLINYYYAEGHYLNVYQQTINEEVYRYWNSIQNVIDREGNMFEPPTGKISSNFENPDNPKDEAFGYFFVTQQDTVRLYVSPEQAGNPLRLCPPAKEESPNGECPFATCCDCLTENISSLKKPLFWVR